MQTAGEGVHGESLGEAGNALEENVPVGEKPDEETIDELLLAAFGDAPANGYEAEVGRTVERVVVEELMALAVDAPMPQARAIASLKLARLRERLEREKGGGDESGAAHDFLLAADIRRFLERDYDPMRRVPPVDPPPGSPIGEP